MSEIRIEQYCDGWTVIYNGNRYSWNHNDEDIGTESIAKLLTDMGHTVEIEECY